MRRERRPVLQVKGTAPSFVLKSEPGKSTGLPAQEPGEVQSPPHLRPPPTLEPPEEGEHSSDSGKRCRPGLGLA